MVQTPPQHDTLTLELPQSIGLHVTQEQFELLADCNRDLRTEAEVVELVIHLIQRLNEQLSGDVLGGLLLEIREKGGE